jgi:Protein of unknown function (DUF3987)
MNTTEKMPTEASTFLSLSQQRKDTIFIDALQADMRKINAKLNPTSDGKVRSGIDDNTYSENDDKNPFPMDGMPPVISDYVNNLSKVYGSPKEFFAMAFIGACCAAVRKGAVLDDGKYKNYPQLYLMYVAPSGIGKTEPDKKGFRRLVEVDKELYQDYQKSKLDWKAECAACKKSKLVEPEKPIRKQLLIDDCTPEALYHALQNNAGLTLHSDELSTWFNNIGRYAKSGEVGRYLSIFDNTTFDISRKADEPVFVDEPYMNIIGGIQPEVLEETLQLNQMRKNGFAQRFLFVYPNNVLKPYYIDAIPNQSLLHECDRLIEYLHNEKFGTLILTRDAKEIFISFSNELTNENRNCKTDYLRAFYSKFEIHCLRIALIIELIKSYPYGLIYKTVTAETLEYAIRLCRYFIFCGLKVERMGVVSDESAVLDKLSVAKFLVHQSGHSQAEAAKIVGVSQQYINKKLKS